MCLDNEDIKNAAGKFLTAMAERYRGNPALMGYDVWNEGGVQDCFCPSTQAKFREWLKAKYHTVEACGRAWHRYSLGDWESVHPPHGTGGYPDSLDWAEFRRDDAIRLLRWRNTIIRGVDKDTKITAHGAMNGQPDEIWWRHAAEVESYGFTWVSSRHSLAPWLQFEIIDLTRAASKGKPFWHAEAEGSNLWLQPQVVNRPLDDGRSLDEKDVRLWNLVDMAGGVSGVQFTRWRPLLDGPLFGAFGPMNMDGSVTPQAEMGSKFARWTNAHPDIWKSHPVKGEVGIVFIPEAKDFNVIQSGNGGSEDGGGARAAGRAGAARATAPAARGGSAAGAYIQSIQGAYQAFFDSNIQADYVSLEDIAQYPMIYVAYPEMLKKSTADKLRAYVANGGKLISEGCPGYFGDGGTVGEVQPNLGLDELFGARQTYVQFTPDILGNLTLTVKDKKIGGGYFLQEYQVTGGQAVGQYANGHVAAVEHTSGKGKTLLIGTFPAGNYYRTHSPETREFFASLLPWGGVEPQIQVSDLEVTARLQTGAGGSYLWVVNPTRTQKTVKVMLPSAFQHVTELWQTESTSATVTGKTVTATVQDRGAAVLRLE